MATVIFNEITLRKKINGILQSDKQILNRAFYAANTRFTAAKKDLLQEYDESKVTEELKEGNAAQTTLLPDDYGNIFSFLGIPVEAKPAETIREFLDQNIELDNIPYTEETAQKVNIKFQVLNPTDEQLFEATPLPWGNMSIVKAISEGLNNFGLYVYHKFFGKESRSKTGLQRKDERAWMSAPNEALGIRWVLEMVRDFRKKFGKQ